MQKAEYYIVSCIEQEHSIEELDMLRLGQSVQKSSPLFRLDVILNRGHRKHTPNGCDFPRHPPFPNQQNVSDLIQ